MSDGKPLRDRIVDDFNRLREQRGMTAAIARGLGISWQSVDRWDVVPLANVFRVAAILRVLPESLRPDFFVDDPMRVERMPASWRAYGKQRQADTRKARAEIGIRSGKLTRGRAGSQQAAK